MYEYFTEERGLNNLIWVLCHSGNIDDEYKVDRKYYDICGPDTYSKEEQKRLYREIERLYGKDIAIPLHECGTLPDPDECLRDSTVWLWWMLWHTSHLQEHDKDELKRIYHHPSVITLDELE